MNSFLLKGESGRSVGGAGRGFRGVFLGGLYMENQYWLKI